MDEGTSHDDARRQAEASLLRRLEERFGAPIDARLEWTEEGQLAAHAGGIVWWEEADGNLVGARATGGRIEYVVVNERGAEEWVMAPPPPKLTGLN
jgi:hypothetical protein